MQPKLTETQSRALDYIRSQVEEYGVAPTLRELCSHMGYSAIGSAQDVVSALRRKGYLHEADRQAARALMLTPLALGATRTTAESFDANTFVIPCLGTVPAGHPVEATESHIGTMRMSMSLIAPPRPPADQLFGLQAQGESMVGAGILDGDWLIVHFRHDAPDGSIVIARVEDEVTVKRLRRDDRGWFLQPENPAFQTLHAEDTRFEVVGRVVALQRAVT